ncbi:hypothetical protein NM688_g5828 [Phlebia brevispora]|uniref:Uncharacterized protein n=1 Tax=Phlebia brevispora TaxID=194682 RepID=A0ACC1SP48_9APHY|nr:hypothetical protein NM688_g5828 [Phlebia brevispora]
MPSSSVCMPYLAQELIDEIIDIFQDDAKSLSVCSLVSRSWSWRSSRYLCRRLRCRFGTVAEFVDLVGSIRESPRLRCFVHELTLERPHSTDSISTAHVNCLLDGLPNLSRLELRGVHFESMPPTEDDNTPFRPYSQFEIEKLSFVGELHSVQDLLTLFRSVGELELRDACISSAPHYIEERPYCQADIKSITFTQSDPDVLAFILSQLPMQLVHLRMDGAVFTRTQAALKFSRTLCMVGHMLKSIHFDLLSRRSRSMAAPDTALWSLDRCVNLKRMSVDIQVCIPGKDAELNNLITGTVLAEILRGACFRALDTLEAVWITVHLNPVTVVPHTPATLQLRRMGWHHLEDSLGALARRRGQVVPDNGVFFTLRGAGGNAEEVRLRSELQDTLKAALSPDAYSVLRFA